MQSIVYILIYLYICNFFQINTTVRVILSKKRKYKKIYDRWIYNTILRKTGVKINDIYITDENKFYGMMIGIPAKPILVLSRKIYKELTRNEIEWVLLHEAVHYKLMHGIKIFMTQLVFIMTGITLIDILKLNIVSVLFLAFITSLTSIQVFKYFEYEADYFSISNVKDPRGVISANKKLIKSTKNTLNDDSCIKRRFFAWNIMKSDRIRMAQERINSDKPIS